MCDALTTPLQVDSHAPHMKWRNDSEWQSEEASLCNNSVVFLLCGDFCVYISIKTATAGEKLACWTEGFSTTDLNFDLDFDNFRVSLLGSFRILLVAGWILLYNDHLENHLVHTGTSSYQCAHMMRSSNSTLVHFFRRRTVRKNYEKLHPVYIFAIGNNMTYWHCIPGAVNGQ